MKYTAVFNSDTDKGCAGKRSRDKVFAIILSLSFLHTLQKVRISLCTRVTAATQEGKGGGEGKDRGVLKLEREMKADFSPFSLLKKKKAHPNLVVSSRETFEKETSSDLSGLGPRQYYHGTIYSQDIVPARPLAGS